MIIFQCRTASFDKECSNYHHGCLSTGIFISSAANPSRGNMYNVGDSLLLQQKGSFEDFREGVGQICFLFPHYTFQSLLVMRGYL
jgi:hypothetical protein